jgi:hypothetical protein
MAGPSPGGGAAPEGEPLRDRLRRELRELDAAVLDGPPTLAGLRIGAVLRTAELLAGYDPADVRTVSRHRVTAAAYRGLLRRAELLR